MEIKIKKREEGGINRIEGAGEIKEVLAKEDLFEREKRTFEICFRGEHCSGIIELSKEETMELSKELTRVSKVSKGFKVLRLKE